MQDCVSSNKIKENKYKILRMSLLLGSGVDREDTFNNFEDSAREIDAMNDEVYLKNIEDKFYDTLKLEEEEKKLSVLVDYIGGRVEQRISLLSDFANVTGYDLQNLPPIKYYDKLDDYKERLNYIREYLDNTAQINKLNDEIEDADKKLNDAYLNRASSEEYNQKIEKTLLDKFVGVFKNLEFFEGVTEENIDEKLHSVMVNVEDSKKSLDIFSKSFNTLSGSGISAEEEQEYYSYVENAKVAYYSFKEQEYVFRLYKLLLSKYTDYSQILYKREEINDILYERLKLRKELRVSSNDIFSSVYDILERQYEDIKRQNVDIENIEKLTKKIQEKREELNRLEIENQKVEILSLLREFCIIDTYNDIDSGNVIDNYDNELDNTVDDITYDSENIDIDNIIETNDVEIDDDISNEVEVKEEPKEEVITEDKEEKIDVGSIINNEEVLDNQVVKVESAIGVDIELIQSKANKVMKRVGEMLGIKMEETKIVSVTNEEVEKENNIFTTDNVSNDVNVSNSVGNNRIDNPLFGNTEVDNNNNIDNPLFGNTEADNSNIDNPLFGNTEAGNSNIDNPLFSDTELDGNIDNPLFGNTEVDNSNIDNPLFGSDDGLKISDDYNNTLFDNNDINNDFWFSSDTPDALNELPDLNISNDDFFANNNVDDLEFPDLNMSFPDDDMEEKI